MRKIIKYILLALNLVAVLALLISYLSVYISPQVWWVLSFFGLAYPVFLVVNIFFIILWLVLKPGFSLISFVAVILGIGFLFRFVQFKGKTIESGDIKVLSYNVQYFAGKGTGLEKQTAGKIMNFLKEEKPDIICLQEVRLRKNSIFNLGQAVEEMDFVNHYQYARSSTTYGSVTMTRFPIVNMGEIRFENSRNISIYTDVLSGDDTLRIFNIHLQSYQVNPDDYSFISSGLDREEDLEEIRDIGSRFKRGFYLRARQVKVIREYIENSPYDIIVCGDFNDTPVSFSYMQLSKGLRDAFVSSGKGIGSTYIGKLPSFRIDYIFHSAGFESYNFQTNNFRYSDHLPVSCSLIKK